jgi:hypothetical protein
MPATFTISNPNSLNGPAWNRTYSTRDEAAAAIATAYRWPDHVIGPSFSDDDEDGNGATSWCVYETEDACENDDTVAHAPRVTRVEDEDDEAEDDEADEE